MSSGHLQTGYCVVGDFSQVDKVEYERYVLGGAKQRGSSMLTIPQDIASDFGWRYTVRAISRCQITFTEIKNVRPIEA